MALADDLRKSEDPVYLELVKANLIKLATDVIVEARSVTDHNDRARVAKSVLANIDNFTRQIARIMAFQGVLDSNIGTALTTNWTKLVDLI